MNTAEKEIKYSKDFDLDTLIVKVNGVYDYDHNVPYFGFNVATTSGVSSPANTNGFSVCKKFEKGLGPLSLRWQAAFKNKSRNNHNVFPTKGDRERSDTLFTP